MNIKEIKALADIMKSHGLTALEVTEGETKIRLEKQISVSMSAPSAPAYSPNSYEPIPAQTADSSAPQKAGIEIKSPMVGVFFAASAPEAEPFIKVGTRIKKGDVLCIIEAMKLMNELTAELEGEVVEVCVTNGEVVEFGQTLFRLV